MSTYEVRIRQNGAWNLASAHDDGYSALLAVEHFFERGLHTGLFRQVVDDSTGEAEFRSIFTGLSDPTVPGGERLRLERHERRGEQRQSR